MNSLYDYLKGYVDRDHAETVLEACALLWNCPFPYLYNKYAILFGRMEWFNDRVPIDQYRHYLNQHRLKNDV
jgi:hypothetical protein